MYYIIVKTEFEGFHRYKDAPEEVSFLRDYHRHIFKVEAKISVDHSNREEEFFLIKRKIDMYLRDTYLGMKFDASCEMVAKNVFDYLDRVCKLKVTQVEVSEDGENVGGYYIA